MHTYISGCKYDLHAVAIVSTAATDVGMHGVLASHHSVLPPCWFTLRASGRATLPFLHTSDFDRNLFNFLCIYVCVRHSVNFPTLYFIEQF